MGGKALVGKRKKPGPAPPFGKVPGRASGLDRVGGDGAARVRALNRLGQTLANFW